MQNQVGNGELSMEDYRVTIEKELKVEEDLLKKLLENSEVKNKEFQKKRINKRIELINAELNEKVEEEPEPEKKEEIPVSTSENKTIETSIII